MNSLFDEDDDRTSTADREFTLSTGTILGIFFALVLLCGAFFGFGYKMGSHKPAPVLQAAPEASSGPSANFSSFKPAAGSPAAPSPDPPATQPAPLPQPVTPAAHSDDPAAPAVHRPATTHDNPQAVTTATSSAAASTATALASPAGSFVVQVAAFTHHEDADLLIQALKMKGYPAFARSEPQDKLEHIQVGPYTNRKDAETARQRLLADGYQPILK